MSLVFCKGFMPKNMKCRDFEAVKQYIYKIQTNTVEYSGCVMSNSTGYIDIEVTATGFRSIGDM